MGSLGTAALAFLTAFVIHRLSDHRGLLPPGFAPPTTPVAENRVATYGSALRLGLAVSLLAAVLWIGVFYPLTQLGLDQRIDFGQLSNFDLFFLHGLLALCLVLWYLLGFAGVPLSSTDRKAALPAAQFGLHAIHLSKEIGIGALVGLGAWAGVVGILVGLGALVWVMGGADSLPESPPELMVWIAGLPIVIRIALSLSAGFFEELFFRGFLQPRIGVILSTILFVLAHVSYAEPLMLVGVTLLSLVFAQLVKWRQSIWSAVAAHAVFDGIQLLVVIPAVLRFSDTTGDGGALLSALGFGLV